MNTWLVATPAEDPDAVQTLYKLATANPFLVFDFGNFDELDADDSTLTGTPVVTVDPVGPTPGAPTLLGAYRVQVQVSNGTAGETYVLTCSATTDGGVTLVGTGTLLVR